VTADLDALATALYVKTAQGRRARAASRFLAVAVRAGV
jgi:hypothetical protein